MIVNTFYNPLLDYTDYNLNFNFLKKHVRYPAISAPSETRHSIVQLPVFTVNNNRDVQARHLKRTKYSYTAVESSVIKSAQHNMALESFTNASYDFQDLGRMYIRQKRFSEAKWYLLQSNNISRRQNDDKLTVSNLIDLATVKANIGDYKLAEEDLTEAYAIATLRGYNEDLVEIEKRRRYIKQNNLPTPKADIRYAEAP